MKICPGCDLMVAEDVLTCPACGREVAEGRKSIDGYTIVEVLHEGYGSILCRAVPHGQDPATQSVMLRIFTPESGIDGDIAARLKRELTQLQALPQDYFVQHREIRQSLDGVWYRVSEWIAKERWGSLLASGRLQDLGELFGLFYRIASILDGLHRIGHFIPHLILDDIIVYRDAKDTLQVKIDYKLSRFLDPAINRPGPMLKRLLDCHPDIAGQRPLDLRSDIWSLGKIFMELLTADLAACDLTAKIDTLPIPEEARVLLKIMLATDPDLRPRSMGEVALALKRIIAQPAKLAAAGELQSSLPSRALRGLNRKVQIIGASLVLILCTGILGFWLYLGRQPDLDPDALERLANRYAPSVAMVLVEYWITVDDATVYLNRSEGTGFLVDAQGYLLTNRHVACPWLEDPRLMAIIARLQELERKARFGYRMYLWFEGTEAFRRLPKFEGSRAIEDTYSLATAFGGEGDRRVTIAGVARPPLKTWERIKFPLRNDFAVLKIDVVPAGLQPLPLDTQLDAGRVPKLSPVITLGFPLGSRTQDTTVNVSVTRGNVRRAFENMLQVDTSLYRGNSGGPIIDRRGKVIGIASSVYTDMAASPIPVATMLSDIGLVLPINPAAQLLAALKEGQRKWNGVLDLEIDDKVDALLKLALENRWQEASRQVLAELARNAHPALVMAAGMIHFGLDDFAPAANWFEQALSMGVDSGRIHWMLFLMDWLGPIGSDSPHKDPLHNLDWRSADEFYGYLVQVLEGVVDPDQALAGGYTSEERGWLNWTVGLRRMAEADWEGAGKLFERAAQELEATTWLLPLALTYLRQTRQNSIAASAGERPQQNTIEVQQRDIVEKWQASRKGWQERELLRAKLRQTEISAQEKVEILTRLAAVGPFQGDVLAQLVFQHAMGGAWEEALIQGDRFLGFPGRETAERLSVGLLLPEILHKQGHTPEARARLAQFQQETQNPWYRNLSGALRGETDALQSLGLSGRQPLDLVTAHSALGFWAEGDQDAARALDHYRQALATFMDDRLEYAFALERFTLLRKSEPQP